NRNSAIAILIKLENGDENPRAGDDSVVERVAELHFPVVIAVTHVQSPRLEIVEARGGMRFAVVSATGHPGFDVVLRDLPLTEIAGADEHDAIGKVQLLKHVLGVLKDL